MQAPAHPLPEKGAECGERPAPEGATECGRPSPGSRERQALRPEPPPGPRHPRPGLRLAPLPPPSPSHPTRAPLGAGGGPKRRAARGGRRVPGTQPAPGLGARMAIPKTLLMCLGLPLFLSAGAQAQNHVPPGCSPDLNPLYYNLCDRSGAWGIILEAVAGAGVVTTFVLTIILVASLPFVQDTKKRSLLGTQVFFLLGTLGLFCLVFACVVKPDFSTCASRRFLFGVLFAICFSCLVAHVFALNFLARKNHGPRGWVIFAVALLLTLVEVIINTEWLIITLVRGSGGEGGPQGNGSAAWAAASPCAIANMDFVMALIYVMLLLLCAFTGAWPALCGRFRRWRKHGVFVLLTTATSMAIWVVWIVMYTYGNRQRNSPTWDDPTLAIALAANAWAFVLFYVIPEVSQVTKASPEQSYQGDMYPTRGVGYETILKEQKGQSMFVENKAFSMDEPASAKRPVSPYSGYNGQLLTSVYQPTEMALMHKGPGPPPQHYHHLGTC
ncbi:G-protein coupled receptor family C group 5 member C isoform X2 [Lutra lutra]|uniref:G-protein coupled receptor family C group 5 member C isoform X2 n=1 Tax=Lutra lutra TaxID=9657 RepID=UPI001FD28B01|nr:G-protein coupled receptor family C group 5 member C isoform X2 [Lutra lutra]